MSDEEELGVEMSDTESVDDDGNSIPALYCKAMTTETVKAILSTLEFDRNQVVVITILEAGLKCCVEKDMCMRAKAYIRADMFEEFTLSSKVLNDENDTKFAIDLQVLLQCLQVFGDNAHLEMQFEADGESVSLLLEDQGVITKCDIKAKDLGDIDDQDEMQGENECLEFRSTKLKGRCVVESSLLRESFGELEVPGAAEVDIAMISTAPYLTMQVRGDSSSVDVEFPVDSKGDHMFNAFEVHKASKHTYSLALVKTCMKALAKSELTNIRFNETGMMSLQHSIKSQRQTEKRPNWVEFVLNCQEQLNDD